MTRARRTVGRIAFVGAGPGDPGLLTMRAAEALAAASVVVTDPDVADRRHRAGRGRRGPAGRRRAGRGRQVAGRPRREPGSTWSGWWPATCSPPIRWSRSCRGSPAVRCCSTSFPGCRPRRSRPTPGIAVGSVHTVADVRSTSDWSTAGRGARHAAAAGGGRAPRRHRRPARAVGDGRGDAGIGDLRGDPADPAHRRRHAGDPGRHRRRHDRPAGGHRRRRHVAARPAVLVGVAGAVRLAGADPADPGPRRGNARPAADARRDPAAGADRRGRTAAHSGADGARGQGSGRRPLPVGGVHLDQLGARAVGEVHRVRAGRPGVLRRPDRLRGQRDRRRGAGARHHPGADLRAISSPPPACSASFPDYDDVLDPVDRVLLPRADIATETLAEGLRERGWEIDDVTAYRTVRAAPPAAPIREAIKTGGFDAVCFTSSSTVRNLVGIAGKPHSRSIVACLGPKTAETAREFGLRVDVQPEVARDRRADRGAGRARHQAARRGRPAAAAEVAAPPLTPRRRPTRAADRGEVFLPIVGPRFRFTRRSWRYGWAHEHSRSADPIPVTEARISRTDRPATRTRRVHRVRSGPARRPPELPDRPARYPGGRRPAPGRVSGQGGYPAAGRLPAARRLSATARYGGYPGGAGRCLRRSRPGRPRSPPRSGAGCHRRACRWRACSSCSTSPIWDQAVASGIRRLRADQRRRRRPSSPPSRVLIIAVVASSSSGSTCCSPSRCATGATGPASC